MTKDILDKLHSKAYENKQVRYLFPREYKVENSGNIKWNLELHAENSTSESEKLNQTIRELINVCREEMEKDGFVLDDTTFNISVFNVKNELNLDLMHDYRIDINLVFAKENSEDTEGKQQ